MAVAPDAHRGEALQYAALAEIALDDERFEDIERFATAALAAELLRPADPPFRALLLVAIARARLGLGDVSLGAGLLEFALAAPGLRDDPRVLDAQVRLHRRLGLDREALAFARRRAAAVDSDDLRGRAAAHEGLGEVLAALGRREEARDAYNDALTDCVLMGDEPRLRRNCIALAALQVDGGDPEGAARRLERLRDEARADGDERLGAAAALQLGIAQRRAGHPAARATLIAALQSASRLGRSVEALRAGLELAQLTAGDGDLASTRTLLAPLLANAQRGLDGLGERESIGAAADADATYATLVRVLLRCGETDKALVVAEQARARALARTLQRRDEARARDLVRGIDDAALTALLRATVAPGVLPPEALARTLRVLAVPSSERVPPRALDRADVQRVAAALGATLVTYAAAGDGRYVAWVVTADACTHVPLPVAEDLDATIVALARALDDGDPAFAAARLLKTLARALVAPLEPFLPSDDGAHVAIVPAGPLFRVPFAALAGPGGTPVGLRFALSTAPAIKVFALLLERRDLPDEPAFVMGDPALPARIAWGETTVVPPPLPGAGAEAHTVAALFGVAPLCGADATKPRVLDGLAHGGVAHLATHGLLDDGAPEASALVVAPAGADAESALLRAGEIAARDVRARLVVLSACSTAPGAISGDGMAGLYRALHVAGARAVIASLWPVSDAAAAVLMPAFYRALLGGADAAAALLAAMRETRARFPQPVDWAPFVLSGLPVDVPARTASPTSAAR